MDEKKVLIFFKGGNAVEYEHAIGDHLEERLIGIQIDGDIISTQPQKAVMWRDYKDFLSLDELDEIDLKAKYFAQNWYKDKKIDTTHLIMLSLEYNCEHELKILIGEFLKNASIIKKINPCRIIYMDDNSLIANLVQQYAKHKNIKTSAINTQKLTEDSFKGNKIKISGMILRLLAVFSNILCSLVRKVLKRPIVLIFPYKHLEDITDVLIREKSYNLSIINPGIWHIKKYFSRAEFIWGSFGGPLSDLINLTDIPNIDMQVHSLIGGLIDYLKSKQVDCSEALTDELEKIFKRKMVTLAQCEKRICKYFSAHIVKALIVNQDQSGLERALVEVCNHYQISTLMMTHGIMFPSDPLTEFVPAVQYVLAWGQSSYDYYVKLGFPEGRIKICGNQYFRDIPHLVGKYSKVKTLKHLGLDQVKVTILFLAPTYANYWAYNSPCEANMIFESYCKQFQILDKSKYQSIIRFHPSTNYYESLADKFRIYEKYYRGNIVIDNGLPLLETINATDIIVGLQSTVILEAMKAEKKIIIFNPLLGEGFNSVFANYSNWDAAFYVNRQEDLANMIEIVAQETENRKRNGQKGFLSYCFNDAYTIKEKALMSLIEECHSARDEFFL